MEVVARSILNNAQTIYDGGVISSILKSVKLTNNSELMNDVLPYLSSAKLTGGYMAGVVFGILWLSALCILVVYSCYSNRHDVRKKDNEFQNHIRKNRRLSKLNKYMDTFLLISTIVMLCFIAILILCFIVNAAQFQSSMKQSSKGFNVNGSKPSAIRPAVKTSIQYIKNYISKFPEEARRNTAPIVDDIIAYTIQMQKVTQELFNQVLMKQMHVTDTVTAGKEMADAILQLFDVSEKMKSITEEMTSIRGKIITGNDVNQGFRYIITEIRSILNAQKNCDVTCKHFKTFFKGHFHASSTDIHSSSANSFLYIMNASNKTKKTVLSQSAESENKLAEMKAKTAREMRKRLDVPQMIRNSTNKNWDLLDDKMPEIMKQIDSFVEKMEDDKVDRKISKLSSITGLIFAMTSILILFFVGFSIVFKIYQNYCYSQSKGEQSILIIALQSCSVLIAVILVLTMIIFLYGGKYETEFCRYIRTNQPIITTNNTQHFVLDSTLNEVLPKLIEENTKSQTNIPPIPKLENIFYGLIHNCKLNRPILKAIGLIDKLDLAAMSDPSMSQLIVKVGREIMNKSLLETDPSKMMPADMKESLTQAKQLKMFTRVSEIKTSYQLLLKKVNNTNLAVDPSVLKSTLTKFQTIYFMKVELKDGLDDFIDQVDAFKRAGVNYRKYVNKIKHFPNIEEIVARLNTSLHQMLKLMSNKPKLLKIANELYDKMIADTTPNKTVETMRKFGPKILEVLGPCKPIYQAYATTVDTVCDVTLSKFNAAWVYMGTCVLIMTLLWIEMIITVYINGRNNESMSSSNDVPMNNVQLSSSDENEKPLFERDIKADNNAKQPMNPPEV